MVEAATTSKTKGSCLLKGFQGKEALPYTKELPI